jgi:hypothetical protein
MRELAAAGLIAIAAGLGSYYATDHFGFFSAANLVLGGLALVVALARGAFRLRSVGGVHSRPVVLRGLLVIAAALAVAVGLERAAARSGAEFDWTGEQSFDLSQATRDACKALQGEDHRVTTTLYKDEGDPRIRRTRLLLMQIAQHCPMDVGEKWLDDAPQDEERYAIGTSNTVVLVLGERFETVGRPTEGTLYEALYRLRSLQSGVITLLRGDGEGDPSNEGALGFSGLAMALATEGYRLHSVASASMSEVPENTDLVLLIAPRRRLRDTAIDALRRYLAGGGRLVALLEPGQESGVEPLLNEYGFGTPESVLVDPASGTVDSTADGLGIVAYNYSTHPTTAGLDSNRMTFFPGVRPVKPRTPHPGAHVEAVVWSSPRSWVTTDLSVLEQRSGRIENTGEPQGYHYIAAIGRYPGEDGETRIAVIGDSDFASNRYLRALYDLDLILNTVHWAVQREANITLRPKIRTTVQFPLPVQNTLRTLYGAGLLVPELLAVAGVVAGMRRRAAEDSGVGGLVARAIPVAPAC